MTLGVITLPASGSREIPVNSTVQHLGYSADQYGGTEFHFEAGWPGALAVETEVVMPEENLAYSVQSFARHDRNSHEQHAVFRLPSEHSEVYFAMYNSSDETVAVSPTIQSGNRSIALDKVRIPPHGFSRTSLHRGDIRGGLKDVGGVTLRHSGPAGALLTTGWLDDDETGFSTMMTFEELGQSHTGTELFGTQIFTSYVRSDIVLKNMSAGIVTAIAEFYPVQDGAVGTATFNIGPIPAGDVQSIDIGKLQKRGMLPGAMDELSVRIRYSGEPGALMGRIFGVSTNGTYGYYSQLEDRTSARRSEIYWTAREGARTLATIANFGDADTVVVELFNAEGASHAAEVELAANEAKTIDLAALGADAFGPGSSGGWNVSRKGGASLVVKNHVIDKYGFSLPFYGASPYVTEIYLTGANPFEMDSADPDHTFQCRKRWSDNFTEPSPGGESSTENSNVATVDIASDPSGNWDVQAVGPGSYNYIRIEQWIPWDETFNFEPQYMMAQADANVKCFITFLDIDKTAEGEYDADFSVSSESCGTSQTIVIGLMPLCTGHTWGYSGTSVIVDAGQSGTAEVVITKTGASGSTSCAHRFTPGCSNCMILPTPGYKDGAASNY